MKLLLVIALCLLFGEAWSQAQPMPLSSDFSYYIEKEVYKKGLLNHTAIQPYLSYQVKIDSQSIFAVNLNDPSLYHLMKDHLYRLTKREMVLTIDPIIDTYLGYQKQSTKKLGKFGAGLRLGFNYKHFSADIAFSGSSTGLPDFEETKASQSLIVPGEGQAFNQSGNWFSRVGLIGNISWKASPFFDIAIGRGKNFIGDGERSLLLSDNSSPYNYVRLSAQVWRFRYMMLYGSMQDIDGNHIGTDLHQKFQVSHVLSLNATKSLNFYLFETIVSNAKDSLGNRGFELSYVDPFIFYRPVEFSMGSPDNVLMGFGGKYLIKDKLALYGHFVLDEFVWAHIFKRDNWWSNKYGGQIGLKWIDALNIEGLTMQGEYNAVRPFTYSHDDPISNYGNMYQPIAHPMGANFEEMLGILRYTNERSCVSIRASSCTYGTDPSDVMDWGSNIYISYNKYDRNKEFGNVIGQGISHKLIVTELKYVYLLNPAWNLQFETSLGVRRHSSAGVSQVSNIFGFGLRTALYRNNNGAFR